MKKLVQINTVCNGSTGKIMCDIAKEASKCNYQTYCFFGRGDANKDLNCIKIDSSFSVYLHLILARFGFNGHGSYFSTKKLVKKLREINPDVIHLHNIHGYYLNIKVLFKYLKNEYKGKIIWTLHDCWAFTGHCAYFTMAMCDKWKRECGKCIQVNRYPKEFFDTSKREYELKKRIFTGLEKLVIITPSNWLKELVGKSFLNTYDIKVINNGIDTEVFKPTFDKNIYDKYNIPKDKKIILGVANIWDERKGFSIFLELSKMIDKDMIIVLVGLNDKQISILPQNIIGISRTSNQKELAALYTLADVFVNPSIEETFSLVTVEAMACDTRVVVCNTSAPKELVSEADIVVSHHAAKEYYHAVNKIINDKKVYNIKENAMKYQNQKMINEYKKMY